MRQASMTAREYLEAAVIAIDEEFGPGYAKNNPALVGDFIKAASMDFLTWQIGVSTKHLTDEKLEVPFLKK